MEIDLHPARSGAVRFGALHLRSSVTVTSRSGTETRIEAGGPVFSHRVFRVFRGANTPLKDPL